MEERLKTESSIISFWLMAKPELASGVSAFREENSAAGGVFIYGIATAYKENRRETVAESPFYDYYPYGKQISLLSTAGELTRPGFTGKEFDTEGATDSANFGIGKYYFGARAYDPEVGIFTAGDPLGQFWNPYAYTGNPLSYVDPNGEFVIEIIVGLLISAGAAYVSQSLHNLLNEEMSPGDAFNPLRPEWWGEEGVYASGNTGGGGDYRTGAGSGHVESPEESEIRQNIERGPVGEIRRPPPDTKRNRETVYLADPLPFQPPTGSGQLQFTGLGLTEREQNIDIYLAARSQYSDVPYFLGGTTRQCIDCSGLFSATVWGEGERRGFNTAAAYPPGGRDVWYNVVTSPTSFRSSITEGDAFIWPRRHMAFYGGGNRLFHAHGDPGDPTGYSNDLFRYWIPTLGYPNVYRQR